MYRLLTKQHTVWQRKILSKLSSPPRHLSQLEFRPNSPYGLLDLRNHYKQEKVMGKRKSSTALASGPAITTVPIPVPWDDSVTRPAKRRKSQQETLKTEPESLSTNPNKNPNVLDGSQALRASPDADEQDESMDAAKAGMDVKEQVKEEDDEVPSLVTGGDSDSALSDLSNIESPVKATSVKSKPGKPGGQKAASKETTTAAKGKVAAQKKGNITEPQFLDPEAEGEEEADEEEIQIALSRPPPVNSDYLPLPWKGRLGYVSFDGAARKPR